jgi:hypothetical protein
MNRCGFWGALHAPTCHILAKGDVGRGRLIPQGESIGPPAQWTHICSLHRNAPVLHRDNQKKPQERGRPRRIRLRRYPRRRSRVPRRLLGRFRLRLLKSQPRTRTFSKWQTCPVKGPLLRQTAALLPFHRGFRVQARFPPLILFLRKRNLCACSLFHRSLRSSSRR